MLYLGFNNGMGFMDSIFNKGKSTAGLETSSIFRKVFDDSLGSVYYRFPGGTHASFYNRFNAGSGYVTILVNGFKGDDPLYMPPNINKLTRDKNYSLYYGYNTDTESAKSNMIYPFINTITSNRTATAKSTYVLNIVNHYRNYTGFTTKKELLDNHSKLDNIKLVSDLSKNGFSTNFITCVEQNLSGIFTLIKNNVIVDKIELGNENYSYMMDGDDKLFKNILLDTIMWNRSTNNTQNYSLDIQAKLFKMYIRLINNLYITNGLSIPLYGVPLTPLYKNSGFKQWNDYWINPITCQSVGYTCFIIHPYTSISKSTDIKPDKDSTSLDNDFKIINQKIEDEHFKKWLKTDLKLHLQTLPPNSEMWFTEWNFGWLIPKIGNTLLGAICYFDEVMSYLDYPQITLCNYHVILNARDTNYVFARFANWTNTTYTDPITTNNKISTDVKYSSNYYAHLLLKQVTKLQFVSSDIKDNFYTKTFKDDTGTYIYFSNKTVVEVNIPLSKKSKVNYISGNNLYDTFGITTFKTTDDITVKRNFNIDVISSFTIPKYSIGYIYTEK